MRGYLYLAVLQIAIAFQLQADSLPKAPQWLTEMSAIPEWWPTVTVQMAKDDPSAIGWKHIFEAEAAIQTNINGGKQQQNERRHLIKYISTFIETHPVSDGDRLGLISKTAAIYARLGDYKRAAREYYFLCDARADNPIRLFSLALQYEHAGDNEDALQIYHFMLHNPKCDSTDLEIARAGIACITHEKRDCKWDKPEWWAKYSTRPEWLKDVSLEFPATSSFDDGAHFVGAHFYNKQNEKNRIKAWDTLLAFDSNTTRENIMARRGMASGYSAINDHYRAIEWAWSIAELFPGCVNDTKWVLHFMSTEFDKLGEPKHAREISDLQACFGAESDSSKVKNGSQLSK